MEQDTKSKQYSEKNTMGIIKGVVQKVFADGYKEGFESGYQAGKEGRYEKSEYVEDGVTYVDLGLPSGTLWADDYLRDEEGNIMYLTVKEASCLPVPSKEQIKELIDQCSYIPVDYPNTACVTRAEIRGQKHKKLIFESTGYIEDTVCREKQSVTFLASGLVCNFESRSNWGVTGYYTICNRTGRYAVRLVKNKS